MSSRLVVEHTTAHEYEGEVLASYNELRISPYATPAQTVLDHRVDVRPATRILRYVDYWGTAVCAFDVHEPHERLVVSGRSLVETGRAKTDGGYVPWESLRDENLRDQYHEFLTPSRYVPADPAFVQSATEITLGMEPHEAAAAVCAWTRGRLTYEAGATDVSTTASEALELGSGVCQDFVHVALGLLRTIGIPARYASGYLHPTAEPAVGEAVVGQSHAWLEAWTGAWEPFDPTNGSVVADRHVLIARGRDYADVSPMKGIYHGPPSARVEVRVAITRVA